LVEANWQKKKGAVTAVAVKAPWWKRLRDGIIAVG
jgi:hypothetical protein